MKVTVKLYGSLRQRVPGYHQLKGIEVDLSDGSVINDLLNNLEITKHQKAVVTMDGRIQKPNDRIPSGAQLHVFQPVHGG